MTAPRGWFSNRGSAILGALALVAVLGVAAIALDDNFRSLSRSQTATVGGVLAVDSPLTSGSTNAAVPAAPGNVSADDKEVKEQCKAGYRYRVAVEASGEVAAPPTQIVDCSKKAQDISSVAEIANYKKYCVPKKGEVLFNCTASKTAGGATAYANCETKECKEGENTGVPKFSPGGAAAGGTDGAPAAGAAGPTAPGGANGSTQVGNAFESGVCDPQSSNYNLISCSASVNAGQAQAFPNANNSPGLPTCDPNNQVSTACTGGTPEPPNATNPWQTPGQPATLDTQECGDGLCFKDTSDSAWKKAFEGEGWTCSTQAGGTMQCIPPAEGSGCQAGQPCNVPTPRPRPQTTFPDPTASNNNRSGASGLGSLGSLLSGMMRGLTQPTPQQPQQMPAQQCSTDPNGYQQQQQQYQQQLQQYQYQMQQYNYQLQQYNYQQQYAGSGYGGYGYAMPPQMPAQPQPCTPSTGNQCSGQPIQPDASQCSAGWQPVMNGSCVVRWQCGSATGAPQASLSCQPQTADVGMTLAMSYSCSSGTAAGSGFNVTTQPAGSATTTIANPPAGTNTATYTLTCNNNGQTTGAQCSVQVNKSSIILVANPKSVATASTSLIGWITSGMQSCVISSPDQPDFTSRNAYNTSVSGTATTSPITGTAHFLLHCQTSAGGTKDATVAVSTGTAGSSGSVAVSSTADGKTINHGDHVTITWSTTGQSSNAAVSLWLVDQQTFETTALIAGGKGTSGTYDWIVPAASSACDPNAANVCGADLIAGHQYQIEADVYTPKNAYVGDGAKSAGAPDPLWGDYSDTAAFTVGQ